MSSFIRPSLTDIHALLSGHCGLIVHFSGTPKGAGSDFDLLFPDDLRKVANGHSQSGLSCSIVKPTDEFAHLSYANATGCIGVVLGLQSEHSLVDAHPHDCGTFMVDGVRQTPSARDMTTHHIDATITCRASGNYNEWIIANYSVLGIFAAAPFRISANIPIDYPDDVPANLRTSVDAPGFKYLSLEEIAAEFPDQPIYSYVNGALVEWGQASWKSIPHSQLYP